MSGSGGSGGGGSNRMSTVSASGSATGSGGSNNEMRDIKEFNINIYEMGVDGSRTERKINKTK